MTEPQPTPDAQALDPQATKRLQQARERYAAAVAAEAQARTDAEPARFRRSQRRAAMVRLAVVAALVAALVLGAIGWWAHNSADDLASTLADQSAAQSAAEGAVVTMLTADPARANDYLRDVLDVTTGDQRIRVQGSRAQLEALVAAQPRPATGQVVSSGVVGAGEKDVTVLVVAQTTTPELVGGDASQNRVGVSMTMKQVGGRWLVAQTEAVS
ncbi:hypothetical protein [Gordonia phthalatica]|uniref:Membrane protein n=1 Tax=Gordonia phthalatica TaxID=1136941 RepID=A0A0N9NF02_9ACTN|nr:hypothetical protein [Gordonia phthalatica]ALG85712.1 membrane protein [Gordonia phthalatica]